MIIKNFLFHRVHPERDPLWDPMAPELFDKIIKFLKKQYQIVTLEDWKRDATPKFKKPLATIGFDDGFKDNIEYAAPILLKHQVKASFYVVTDCIDKNVPTWTYEFDYRFNHTKKLSWELSSDFQNLDIKTESWGNKSEQLLFATKLKPQLKKWNDSKRKLFLAFIKVQFNDVEIPKIMMDWNDVRELKRNGFEIGSHTVSHAMLGNIDNEKEIRDELMQSKLIIERELKDVCYTISYPVGSYNDQVKKLSQEAGYQIGLAVGQQFYETNQFDNFEIPRTELYNESMLKNKLRMNGMLENIKKWIR